MTFGTPSPAAPFVVWVANGLANMWPIVPTLIAVLGLSWRGGLKLTLAYAFFGALAVSLVTLAGQVLGGRLNTAPLTNMYGFAQLLILAAAGPFLLLLLTGWGRVRAVTPLALSAILLLGFGSLAFRDGLIRAFDRPSVQRVFLGLSARVSSSDAAYYGLYMIVALPIGWLAWRLLKSLASWFERKRFSDVQLIVDCWWVIVAAADVSTSLAVDHGLAGLGGGALAFLAYRTAVWVVLKAVPLPVAARPKRLLLLRVFGFEQRTASLFDQVAERWRFQGPVQFIAGVDLATRAVDPGDMLAFVRGRLADQYVASPADVPQQMVRLDVQPDPDGRFRVTEFYCYDDTWRPVLLALVDSSDSILMDVRSLSQKNMGCVFELQQLVSRAPSQRIVLVCDRSTDYRVLAEVVGHAWRAACVEGRVAAPGQIALMRVEGHHRRDLGALLGHLDESRAPGRLLEVNQLADALS